jgi:hypothetical protein
MTATVDFTGTLATTFMGVLSIPTMTATGKTRSVGQIEPPPGASDPDILVEENFDVSGITDNAGFNARDRAWGFFRNFNNWKTNKAGIEIGRHQSYTQWTAGAPPNGLTHVAELDAGGNTYMARRIYLTPGTYELRYYYADRYVNTDYTPVHICGSSTADIAWSKSDFRRPGSSTQTSHTQLISAYLELANTDVPPAAFSAAEHNEVDACVLSSGKWIERSVKIKTYAAGFYWLAFQAEGDADGYGGVLTGIRFCKVSCPGAVMENFPWTANQTLFSDNFETKTGDESTNWTERTLDNSGTNVGWTKLPTGWTTWPENQIDFHRGHSGLAIELDASRRPRHWSSNRGVSRRFLLMPGFYKLSYYYRSHRLNNSATYCGFNNINENIMKIANTNTAPIAPDSLLVRAFIDPHLNYSHPRSEPVVRALASWFDPDGSAPSLPRLPSTVVDACVSSPSFTNRLVNFKIGKTGWYWLTFEAGGAEDQHGGIIDDVTLTALGPLSGPAPADVVSIPFGGIAPGSTITKRHLELIAN